MNELPPRQRLTRIFASLDRITSRVATDVFGWLGASVATGLCLGISLLWFAARWGLLPRPGSAAHLAFAFAGIACYLAFVGGAVFVAKGGRKRWRAEPTVSAVAKRVNWRFTWLLAVPFIQALADPLEGKHDFRLLTFATIAALAIGASVYHFCEEGGWLHARLERKTAPWLAWACLFVAFSVYAALMSKLSIANLLAFNMGRSDMGYYVNIFRQSSLGVPLGMSLAESGSHLTGHFDPILVLLSPIYLIYPFGETILVLQSLWLGSGVFPLFLLARHFGTGRLEALVLCVAFILYPALHGINLFDFHSLALCVPIIIWVLYFFEQGRKAWFCALLLLLLSVREDMSLVTCFIGIYALISGKPHGRRWGWMMIACAVVWLLVTKGLIMGRSDLLNAPETASNAASAVKKAKAPTSGYAYYYSDLVGPGGNTLSLISTLIGKPLKVVGLLLQEAKVLYFLQLMLPLLALPLLAKRSRVLLVYGLLFTLLASREHVHSVHFQYSATIVPFTFPLAAQVLASIKQGRQLTWLGLNPARLTLAACGAILTLSILCSWKYGGWIPNKSFRGGFRALERSPTAEQLERAAWLKTICDKLPFGAKIAANSRTLPHLGNCMNIYLTEKRKRADYLIFSPGDRRVMNDIERERESGALIEVERHGSSVLYKTAYGEAKKLKPRPKKAAAKRPPAKKQPAKKQPVKKQPAKEQPAKEQPAKEQPAKEQQGGTASPLREPASERAPRTLPKPDPARGDAPR